MIKILRLLVITFLATFFAGCASKTYSIQIHNPIKESKTQKQLVLFLDGTENNRDSRTNVAALSEIVKHQDKDNLYMFYNEGVGTDGRVIGAGTGWGINKDVAEAYAFLSQYYSDGSKLYIFGFSRGSYTSRILAGMIYAIGIYDLSLFNEEVRHNIASELYTAYKGECKDVEKIKFEAGEIIKAWEEETNINIPKKYDQVMIDVMGIWDTVEALGLVPTFEAIDRNINGTKDPQNIINPNKRYIDQICNIRYVYHALSLDDNRANLFTPIIISSDYVASGCNGKEAKIDEVWFAGAHADVGGGYEKNENNAKGVYIDRDVSISGISLNWMMSKVKKVASDLLPEYASVFANPLAFVHNAQNGDLKYAKASRSDILAKYINKSHSRYGKLKVHGSVFTRLSKTKTEEEQKQLGYDSEWYKEVPFKDCFDDKGNGSYIFKGCKYIEKVE